MTEEEAELLYHLRELRFDLGAIREDLEIATSIHVDLSVVRGWSGAAALLEHDLEVHFPRALALLGATLPEAVAPRSTETVSNRRSPGAEILAATAKEAGRMVDVAFAALPPDTERPSSTAGLIEAARICAAVHHLIADRSEQVLDEELVQHLPVLRAELGSIQAKLQNAAAVSTDSLSSAILAWTEAKALLEHDLEVRFPRTFQILAEDPPEVPQAGPRSTLGSPGQHADAAASLAAAAREAGRLVAAALMLLPSETEPSSCTTGLSEAFRASAAAHRIMAGAHELFAGLAEPA